MISPSHLYHCKRRQNLWDILRAAIRKTNNAYHKVRMIDLNDKLHLFGRLVRNLKAVKESLKNYP